MTGLCIVFDLDDTLYPEASFARSGLRAAGLWAERELGLPGMASALLALFDGGRRGDLFDAALRQSGPAGGQVAGEAIVARMIDVYRTHTPELALFEDAAWAIGRYAALCPLALLTDGYADVQKSKFTALGVAGRFRHVVYTDALGGRATWKPSPTGFAEIEQAIPDADAFVYVADNATKDFVAPNARGWNSVRIVRPLGEYRTSAAPAGGEPRHTITSLTQLPRVLEF